MKWKVNLNLDKSDKQNQLDKNKDIILKFNDNSRTFQKKQEFVFVLHRLVREPAR